MHDRCGLTSVIHQRRAGSEAWLSTGGTQDNIQSQNVHRRTGEELQNGYVRHHLHSNRFGPPLLPGGSRNESGVRDPWRDVPGAVPASPRSASGRFVLQSQHQRRHRWLRMSARSGHHRCNQAHEKCRSWDRYCLRGTGRPHPLRKRRRILRAAEPEREH